MKHVAAILVGMAMMASLNGCSCLDDDCHHTSKSERFDAQTDNQYKRTTKTTESDCGGTSVSERSKVWNRQSDGSWKYAGEERRSY